MPFKNVIRSALYLAVLILAQQTSSLPALANITNDPYIQPVILNEPSKSSTIVPPQIPQGKALPALKLLPNGFNDVKSRYSIGLTYSDSSQGGVLNLSPSIYMNDNWAIEFNIWDKTYPYMGTGIISYNAMDVMGVYHQAINNTFGLYGGIGIGESSATYTLNNWRTMQNISRTAILAYTAGIEIALSPSLYLRAGYRNGYAEVGLDITRIDLPLPPISRTGDASSTPALAIQNKDITFPPYVTIGLTYSTIYDISPNLNFTFYLKDNKNMTVECNVGTKRYYYQTGEYDKGIADLMLVYRQAINDRFGWYGGGGIGYISTTVTPYNTLSITYPPIESSITIAYTAGLEIYITNYISMKAGYRDGGFEIGVYSSRLLSW